MRIKLHDYWRSGAAYRVRLVLALKGIPFESVSHDLRLGEQVDPDYLSIAPIGLVPAIEVDDEHFVLTQSLAIMEWVEERFPEPPLLPKSTRDRAIVRSMCDIICCDTHPLNNLRVLNWLRTNLGADEAQVKAWIGQWIAQSFQAIEGLIKQHGEGFAFGKTPTLADCCLLPQVYSARRFDVALNDFPHILSVENGLVAIEEIVSAGPERHPGARSLP